jgi:membrane protein
VFKDFFNRIAGHRYFNAKPARVLRGFAEIYIRQHVPRSAAALSYYLTISVFPLLICVTAILGSLHITEPELFAVWEDIIPAAALGVISDFLGYLGGNMSAVMLVVGITTMLTSSSATFRTIMNIMGDLQGMKRFKGFWGHLASFAISGAFLGVIYVSGLVIVTGEWFTKLLERNFNVVNVTQLWLWIRFLILFALMFAMFYTAYKVSAPKKVKNTRGVLRLPGALAAAILVVVVSAVFSRLISASTKYALVYGSLASIIILMTWIYTCALIFLLGNVFNLALAKSRKIEENYEPFV